MHAAVCILHDRMIHLMCDRMWIVDVTVTVAVAVTVATDAIVAGAAITTATIASIANVLLMMMMVIRRAVSIAVAAVVAANFRRLIANARCICAAIWIMSLRVMNDVIMCGSICHYRC